MKVKVKKAFDLLQGVTIKATEYNVSVIEFVLNTLREVYNQMKKEEGNNDKAE